MARSIQKIVIQALYFLPLAPQASWLLLNDTYVSPNKNDQSHGWAEWDSKGDCNSAQQPRSHEREVRDWDKILKCEIDLNNEAEMKLKDDKKMAHSNAWRSHCETT